MRELWRAGRLGAPPWAQPADEMLLTRERAQVEAHLNDDGLRRPGADAVDAGEIAPPKRHSSVRYTCVPSIATVSTPCSCSQSASYSSCGVVVPNTRTLGLP